VDAADAAVTIDAAAVAIDAPVDAPPQPPSFAVASFAHDGAVLSLTYSLTVPPGTNRYLLVSVQLGSYCGPPVGVVSTVTYGGKPLTRIASIVGTPCGIDSTKSEQWQMIDPAVGTDDIVVTLATAGATIHSGALAFTGINQVTPVRASTTLSGEGTSSSLSVNSAPGDIVVNTVGHGGGIIAPGAGQTQQFLDNTSGGDTLDNAAASTMSGAASSVTMTWTFAPSDQWQTISTSLQP
jgi:hypothetical protein